MEARLELKMVTKHSQNKTANAPRRIRITEQHQPQTITNFVQPVLLLHSAKPTPKAKKQSKAAIKL